MRSMETPIEIPEFAEARRDVAGGAARHGAGAAGRRRLLAADAGLRRPGVPRQRRLHGPRQLGHRPQGRGAATATACSGWWRLASLMAIVMQVLSARLGIVTGKDLAQACRDYYPAWTRWPNWLACEVAIAACDLAEVLGSAVALNLLFHIPLFWAVIITAFDVLLLLALQGLGMRFIEAVILVLVATIGGLLLHRDFRPAANAARASRKWATPCLRPACARRG